MFTRSGIIVFFVVLAFDQLTKFLALEYLILGQAVPIIPSFFNLTLVYNPGAAFGVFSDLEERTRHLMLLGVSLLAVVVILRLAIKEARGDFPSLLALSAICAGAVGNLIDRLRFDYVVDFIDVYWGSYHWPAFNVADSAISFGVIVVMLRLMFERGEKTLAASGVKNEAKLS